MRERRVDRDSLEHVVELRAGDESLQSGVDIAPVRLVDQPPGLDGDH